MGYLEGRAKVGSLLTPEVGLAHVVVGVAMEYVDHRLSREWRGRFPALAEAVALCSARPSFEETKLGTEP